MYGTPDFATIVQRREQLQPDLCLYVVDQRQADHFTQVFRGAERAGVVTRSLLGELTCGDCPKLCDSQQILVPAHCLLGFDELIQSDHFHFAAKQIYINGRCQNLSKISHARDFPQNVQGSQVRLQVQVTERHAWFRTFEE